MDKTIFYPTKTPTKYFELSMLTYCFYLVPGTGIEPVQRLCSEGF